MQIRKYLGLGIIALLLLGSWGLGLGSSETIEGIEVGIESTLEEDTDEYTLSVREPVGEGTVEVDGQRIEEWPYVGVYENNTEVNLKAEAEENWGFNYWGGDVTGSKRREYNITLEMDEDKDVQAYFGRKELKVNVQDGEGIVIVEWDGESHTVEGTDTLYFAEGTEVTLKGEPEGSWAFDYWGGDITGSKRREKDITLTMDDDKTLSAHFIKLFDLTVEIIGEGSIEIDGEEIEDDWIEQYKKDTEVELVASPFENWSFSHWRGDYPEGEERNESITIMMDTDKNIQALFSENYTVDIYPTEDQTITAGDSINFTAVAYDEYNYTVEESVDEFTWNNIYDINETANVAIFYQEMKGEYYVTVAYENFTSQATTVTVLHSDLVDFWIEPKENTITAGEMKEYTAMAVDEFGNEFEVTEETTWEIEDDAGGQWDDNVYTSEYSGDWTIEGGYGGHTDTVDLKVEPAAEDYIEISPEDSTIKAGEPLGYNAIVYDQHGNEIGDVTDETEWSDDIPNSSWEGNEITAYTAGEDWEITGEYDGFEDTTTLTVEPAEVYHVLIVEPEEDQTIEAGDTIEFSAEAYDEYDNLITDDDAEFRWVNTEDTGLFDETEASEYDVTATYENVTSDTVTVTVKPAEVDYVLIDPAENQTIRAGEIIEFDASAYDEYDNLITDDPEEFDWTNAKNGIFEKIEAGEYEVKAGYDGVLSEPVVVNNLSNVKPSIIFFSGILTAVVGLAVYKKMGGVI